MTEPLEAPESPDETYLARGDDVSAARPLLTGDVVLSIEIPGLDDGERPAIVLAHPCGMRRGAALATKILVARVDPYQEIPFSDWPTSHYKLMPLPEAHITAEHSHWAVQFEDIGMVRSELLVSSTRVACLSRKGINLLQQRFIWHLTRLAVPTSTLDQVAAAVFEEVDCAEEWIGAAIEHGATPEQAFADFHEWIRATDVSGTPRQDGLADGQRLPQIRRDLRAELERRSLR